MTITKRRYTYICLLLGSMLCFSFASTVLLCADEQEYNYRFQGAGGADQLRTFLGLRSRLQERRIRKKEHDDIYFAMAEYYFMTNALRDARRAFKDYISENPNSIETLIANVFLYKIAGSRNKEEERAALKEEIFRDRFVLLFNEYKTLNYTSLYKNQYEVRYFVDKIEVFLNGDLFEEIVP